MTLSRTHQIFRLVKAITVILLCTTAVGADEVPHPSLNIPYLCTFGNESGRDWGDDDFSQTIFFAVPEKISDSLYIRIFDPDVGGLVDEIQDGGWNTETRFTLYGGDGVFKSGAEGIQPEGDYRSGMLLADQTFGLNPLTDGKWIVFSKIAADEGEYLPSQNEEIADSGDFIFKIIIEGTEGDDGNLYKLDFSFFPDRTTTPSEVEVFAYEWSFRLPNDLGATIYTFPFLVPRDFTYVIHHLWDFDNDNRMYLNSPTRAGLTAYISGNNDWAVTGYNFDINKREPLTGSGKRWFRTTYNILEEDYHSPWTFVINKGTFHNNDIVVAIADQNGRPIPMYSTTRPRSGVAVSLQGELFEAKSIILEDNLLVAYDIDINASLILEKNTVLPKGTKLAKGTVIPQDVVTEDGYFLEAGSTLMEDLFFSEDMVLQDEMILEEGSALVKNTMISKGSEVHDEFASNSVDLPPCNMVIFDASGSIDPDEDQLTFHWDLGDGTTLEGEKIMHTYRQPGSYIVSVVTRDNVGAVNSEISKGVLVNINAPPVAEGGADQCVCSGETVRFDGTKSYDPDGSITEYIWSFGNAVSTEGPIVEYTYEQTGSYLAQLSVSDNSDSDCSSDMDVILVLVNEPPVARADYYPTDHYLTFKFDATKSSDPDGKIVKYLWYFGDGTIGEGSNPIHTYGQLGTYTATLIVFDESNTSCNKSSITFQVAVDQQPASQVMQTTENSKI